MLGGLPGKTLVLLACLLSVADGFSSVPSGVALGAASSRLSLSCGSHKASNGVVHGLGGLVMSGQEGGANMERRSFIGLAGLAAGVSLSAPSASNADMAPMGSDVLDRCVELYFTVFISPRSVGRCSRVKRALGSRRVVGTAISWLVIAMMFIKLRGWRGCRGNNLKRN